jgi:hypothetical protein
VTAQVESRVTSASEVRARTSRDASAAARRHRPVMPRCTRTADPSLKLITRCLPSASTRTTLWPMSARLSIAFVHTLVTGRSISVCS